MLKKHTVGSSTSGFLLQQLLLIKSMKKERIFFHCLICIYNSHGTVATNSSLHTYIQQTIIAHNSSSPYHQQATHPTIGRQQGKSLGYHIGGLCDGARHPTYAPSSVETHYNFCCERITNEC
jgi:hypothetical protein